MSKTDIINKDEVISSLQLKKTELKTFLAQEETPMQNIHKVQETLIRKTRKNKKIKRELKGLHRDVKQTKSDKATSRKRKFVEDSGAEEEVPSIKFPILGNVSRQDLMRKKCSTVRVMKALGKKLAGLKLELRETRDKIKVVCTQARNTYTQKKFERALDIAMMRMSNAIKTDIFPMLQKCISASTQKAEEACKELIDGDVCFQTWKAICRRLGKFSNKKNVNYDWVGVFSEPFLGHLAKPWENVFSSQMQDIHDDYARRIATAINRFSIDIKPLLLSMSEASASRSPLDFLAKVPYLQRKTRAAITESLESARSQAQGIHRAVEPFIQDHLRPVYEKCSRESKKGALARMKENLFEFIQETNETMYSESSTVLKTKLAKMTNKLEKLLREAHSDTSHYLREEIRNMIMWAVAKDDEAREKFRETIRKELTVQLDTLGVAWARGASEPADRFLLVKTETKPDDDSSEDDDEDDDISDNSDSSDDSEEAEGTSDDMEDSLINIVVLPLGLCTIRVGPLI